MCCVIVASCYVFFSSRRRHTRCLSDWSSDVCSSDLAMQTVNTYERLLRICGQSCVLLVAISACFCFHPCLRAQTFDSRTAEKPNQSWTATTDSTSDNLKPTRTTETHMQYCNRTLDQ